MQAKPPLQRQIEQKLQQSPDEQKARLITPHPDYEVYTPGQLTEDMARVKAEIAQADVVHDKELVSWLRCELALNFAAQRSWAMKEAEVEAKHNGAAAHKPAQQHLWPDSLSAKEFFEQTPEDPDRWLWEDALTLGSCSMLVAKPKVGKSTFAAALALAIARGHPFLNRGLQKGPALYIYLDGPKQEIKDIFDKFGMTENDQIRIFAEPALGGPRAVDWLAKEIESHKLKFIVIDPIQKFFNFRELTGTVVTPAMNQVQVLLEKYNSHVMYSHHASKLDGDDFQSFIGSQAFWGNVYAMFHMKRLAPDSRQRILSSQGRGGKFFEQIAISDGEDGCIEKIGGILDAWIEEKKAPILEFLEESPGSTEKEINGAVEGRNTLISKTIRALMKKNVIERTGKGGRSGKAEVFRYYLAGSVFKADAERVVDLFPKSR